MNKPTDKNRLSIVRPDLCEEWDYEKNYPLRPEDVCRGTLDKAWWKCKHNHSWKAAIHNRSKKDGVGCPYCSGLCAGENNSFVKLMPEIVKQWSHKNTIDINSITIKSHKKIWWVCEKGHEWKTVVSSRSNGRGCPYCSGRCSTEENNLSHNKKLILEWNYQKNKKHPREYCPQSNKKVWWKCKNNHEWEDTISHRASGRNCPYCSGKRVTDSNSLISISPFLAKEWHPTKNGELTPKNVSFGSGKKIWWKCKNGHEWISNIPHRLGGNGCPYCGGRYPTKENNLSNNKFLVSEWNWEKNKKDPSKYTPKSDEKVWWKCKKGHEWKTNIGHRAEGTNCPICRKIKLKDGFVVDSLVEAYYYLKLKSRKIKFIYNKVYGRKDKKRFDFYIPKFNTYIEITGFNKDGLKRSNISWFSYLRNIAQKKQYVEKTLHKKFRFIQVNLNKKQLECVRKYLC